MATVDVASEKEDVLPESIEDGIVASTTKQPDITSADSGDFPLADSDEEEEVDFGLFWDGASKTIIQCVNDPQIGPRRLKRRLQNITDVDDVNAVEKTKDGFGAIHYLAKGRHEWKNVLLRVLIIYGGADVDLTTTRRGLTALHLAVEEDDFECVRTLISLGADVNMRDLMHSTPLSYAMVGPKLMHSHDILMSTLDQGHATVTRVQSEKEDTEIIKLLRSVGAVQLASPSLRRPPSRDERVPSLFNKINTSHFRETNDHIQKHLREVSLNLTPEQALDLVKKMKQHEQYRRKCGSRILCLDGGGIRGLVQLEVLREIEARTKKRIVDLFDWIIGTSTGGIIALALTYTNEPSKQDNTYGVGGKTVRQLRDLYFSMKNDVFAESKQGLLSLEAKGNTKKLEKVLQTWFGKNVCLHERKHPKVLIPAVYKKTKNLQLHIFNNCFGGELSKERLWKVARYTSAAPFYFSEFEDYVDGGLLANNPSDVALTSIQEFYRNKGEMLPISLLVSIGTGINPGKPLGTIDVVNSPLNAQAWRDFLEVVESSMLNKQTASSCPSRCKEQGIEYFRFNPTLEDNVDGSQKEFTVLSKMVLTTRQYLAEKEQGLEIDRLVTLLTESDLTTT